MLRLTQEQIARQEVGSNEDPISVFYDQGGQSFEVPLSQMQDFSASVKSEGLRVKRAIRVKDRDGNIDELNPWNADELQKAKDEGRQIYYGAPTEPRYWSLDAISAGIEGAFVDPSGEDGTLWYMTKNLGRGIAAATTGVAKGAIDLVGGAASGVTRLTENIGNAVLNTNWHGVSDAIKSGQNFVDKMLTVSWDGVTAGTGAEETVGKLQGYAESIAGLIGIGGVSKGVMAALKASKVANAGKLAKAITAAGFGLGKYEDMATDPAGPRKALDGEGTFWNEGNLRQEFAAVGAGTAEAVVFGLLAPFKLGDEDAKVVSPFVKQLWPEVVKRIGKEMAKSGTMMGTVAATKEFAEAVAGRGTGGYLRDDNGQLITDAEGHAQVYRWNPKTLSEVAKTVMSEFAVGSAFHVLSTAGGNISKSASSVKFRMNKRMTAADQNRKGVVVPKGSEFVSNNQPGISGDVVSGEMLQAMELQVEQNRKTYAPYLNAQAIRVGAARAAGIPQPKGLKGTENVRKVYPGGEVEFDDGSIWRPAREYRMSNGDNEAKLYTGKATITVADGTILDAETGALVGYAPRETRFMTERLTADERYLQEEARPESEDIDAITQEAKKRRTDVWGAGGRDAAWYIGKPESLELYLETQDRLRAENIIYERRMRGGAAFDGKPPKRPEPVSAAKETVYGEEGMDAESRAWLDLTNWSVMPDEYGRVGKMAIEDVTSGNRSLVEAWREAKNALGVVEEKTEAKPQEDGAIKLMDEPKGEMIGENGIKLPDVPAPEPMPVEDSRKVGARQAALFLNALDANKLPVDVDCAVDGLIDIYWGYESSIHGRKQSKGLVLYKNERPIIVLVSEDGSKHLVCGRGRVAAAKERGEKTIPAVYLKSEDGWNHDNARIFDALENMRDGQKLDDAQVMRAFRAIGEVTPEDLEALGIDIVPKGDEASVERAKQARTVLEAYMYGSEPIQQAVLAGKLDTGTARLLGLMTNYEALPEWRLAQEGLLSLRDQMSNEAFRNLLHIFWKNRNIWDPEEVGQLEAWAEEAKKIDMRDVALENAEVLKNVDSKVVKSVKTENVVEQMRTEPVETEDGSMKTLEEVKSEKQREAGGAGTENDISKSFIEQFGSKGRFDPPQTPEEAAMRADGENAVPGTKPEPRGDGTMLARKLPHVRTQLSDEGMTIEGMRIEDFSDPKKLIDTAAFLQECRLMSKGKPVTFVGEGCEDASAMANLLFRQIDRHGLSILEEKAQQRRVQLLGRLAKSELGTGVTTDAESFAAAMEGRQGQLWVNSKFENYACVTPDGVVHLNPVAIDMNAPIHEYGHLALEAMKTKAPKLLAKGMQLVGGSEIYKQLKADEIYGKMSDEEIRNEALTRLIEKSGEILASKTDNGIKVWLKEFWREFKNVLGLGDLSDKDVEKMTLRDITDAVAGELFRGREFGKRRGRDFRKASLKSYDEGRDTGSNGLARWWNDRGRVIFRIPVDRARTQPGGKVVFATDDANITDWIQSALNGYTLILSRTGKLRVKGAEGLPKHLADIFGYHPEIGMNDGMLEEMASYLGNDSYRNLTPQQLVDMVRSDRENYIRWKESLDDQERRGKTAAELEEERYRQNEKEREEAERAEIASGNEEEIIYDLLDVSRESDRIWERAKGEVEIYANNRKYYEPFSPKALTRMEPGDTIHFDHSRNKFSFVSFDPESGELVAFLDTPKGNGTVKRKYRVSEDGLAEVKDDTGRREAGSDEDLAGNEERAETRGGEQAQSSEGFSLEAATADEIAAEERYRRDQKEIARRISAPLKTGTGEVGQGLFDLGGLEGEDLFNRTQLYRPLSLRDGQITKTVLKKIGETDDIGNALFITPTGKMVDSKGGKVMHSDTARIGGGDEIYERVDRIRDELNRLDEENPQKFDRIWDKTLDPLAKKMASAEGSNVNEVINSWKYSVAECLLLQKDLLGVGKKISIDEAIRTANNYKEPPKLEDMLQEGAIRVASDNGGLDLGSMPTEAQFDIIRDWVDYMHEGRPGDKIYIEARRGNDAGVMTYAPKTAPGRIINDIREFYQTGKAPQGTADGIATFLSRPIKDAEGQMLFDFDAGSKETEKLPIAVMPSMATSKPWPKDFPELGHQTTRGVVKAHPDLAAAFEKGKTGDTDAAEKFIKGVTDWKDFDGLAKRHPNAIIVPVRASDLSGRNVVPRVFAHMIGKRTGLKVSDEIFQTETKKRRGGNFWTHLRTPVTFTGRVEKGREYVLVDDHCTYGTTFAALRNFIESNGGKVIECHALTASERNDNLFTVTDYQARNLRIQIPEIDEILREQNIAGSVEALTQGQYQGILREADAFRNAYVRKGGTGAGSPDTRTSRPSRKRGKWSGHLGPDDQEIQIRQGELSRPIAGEGVTPDVFRADRKLRITEFNNENDDGGLAGALEKQRALRPWTAPDSPAANAKPIALDAADLTLMWRRLVDAKRLPKIYSTDTIPGHRNAIGLNAGGVEISEVARIFGVLDHSDFVTQKNELKKEGYFKSEDPEKAVNMTRGEIAADIEDSKRALNERLQELFKERVKTGKGGMHYATQVLGHEIGHTLHWMGEGDLGLVMNSARNLLKAMTHELRIKTGKGERAEIENLIARWHGTDTCPAYYEKAQERFAELFGIFLTQPEYVQRHAPRVYDTCVKLLGANTKLAQEYRTICEAKWNGHADDMVLAELEKTWDAKYQHDLQKLRDDTSTKAWTWLDEMNFGLNDRFGPMFAIPERAVKALEAEMDMKVEKGLTTREMASMRIENARARINALRSGLYDWQRMSGGEERLMVTGFGDVIENAKREGVNWFSVRRYAHLMRVIEIGGRATAHAIDPSRAAKLLDRMKEQMGDAEYRKVEKTWKAFRAVYEKYILDDPRVMAMFNKPTQEMLRRNSHYVTMRHTMSAEELAAFQKSVEEFQKGNSSHDPSLEIYLRIHHGLGGVEGTGDGGYQLHSLKGSFDATLDPITETIRKAIEIKRAAAKNSLIMQLADTLVGCGVKDVYDNAREKVRSERFGTLVYMKDGEARRLVLPRLIEKCFTADAGGTVLPGVQAFMRGLRNTMTLWNPSFINRAYLQDKAALETNLKGMHKAPIGIIADALMLKIPFVPGRIPLGLPLYAVDNYLSRFSGFTKTWIGKMLYNEHTVNYYTRQAQKIASVVYEGRLGEELRRAKALREQGDTAAAAEIEENVQIAEEMLKRNVFQSQFEFNKLQKAQTPEDIMRAFSIEPSVTQELSGIKQKGIDRAKRFGRAVNRFEEEQEAITKIVAWLYDSKTNPNRDLDARARLVIEQGGTPNLSARGILATRIENATGFFWNVRKEAFLRSWRAFKDHPTEWAVKAFAQTALPTLIKEIAICGGLKALCRHFIFDDDDEAMEKSALAPIINYYDWEGYALRNVPGYQQRNYNVIPLWTPGSGGTFALRVKLAPEEFAVVNAVHAAMQRILPDPTDPDANVGTAIRGVVEELMPDMFGQNPALMWTYGLLAPWMGVNPRDNFRDRNLYSEDAMLARWKAPGYLLRENMRNFVNYSPIGSLVDTITDPKDVDRNAGTPAGIDALLRGCPVLSKIPASCLGFYAEPDRNGVISGYKRLDRERLARLRLQSGDVLSWCIENGSLAGADAQIRKIAGNDIKPEDRAQIYKFLIAGWRKHQEATTTSPAAKMMKQSRLIKDTNIRQRAHDFIREGLELDD